MQMVMSCQAVCYGHLGHFQASVPEQSNSLARAVNTQDISTMLLDLVVIAYRTIHARIGKPVCLVASKSIRIRLMSHLSTPSLVPVCPLTLPLSLSLPTPVERILI